MKNAIIDFDLLFAEMRAASDPRRKRFLGSYFGTTGPNPFSGLTAVAARSVAVRFAETFDLRDARRLLASDVPEHRFVALEILVRKYETLPADREAIAKLYISSLRYVDHWVLVDTSAPYILGDYLLDKNRTVLFELASSTKLAERRIAIIATLAFIRADDFRDTLRIAEMLLQDEHELIQRAVGWMLREVGKRSRSAVKRFLDRHYRSVPRLMLRYAIARLPPSMQRRYRSHSKRIQSVAPSGLPGSVGPRKRHPSRIA